MTADEVRAIIDALRGCLGAYDEDIVTIAHADELGMHGRAEAEQGAEHRLTLGVRAAVTALLVEPDPSAVPCSAIILDGQRFACDRVVPRKWPNGVSAVLYRVEVGPLRALLRSQARVWQGEVSVNYGAGESEYLGRCKVDTDYIRAGWSESHGDVTMSLVFA